MVSSAASFPAQLRRVAQVVKQEGRDLGIDRRLDRALFGLFADVEVFEQLVLPALGKDIEACEEAAMEHAATEDRRLGFREFLGLFLA